MRKLLIILFLLTLLLTATPVQSATMVSGRPCPGGATNTALANCSGPMTYTGSSGCLMRETFEGCAANCTSCTSGYTWTVFSGTPGCANTTTPLQGSQSYGGTADSTVIEIYTTQVAIDGYGELYGTFAMKIASCSTGYPIPFGFSNSTGADVATISNAGECRYRACTEDACTAPTTLSADTLYYVKLYTKKGTGANAIVQWWTSTDGTTWTNRGSITDGANTNNMGRPWVFYQSEQVKFDDVRVSTTDINY